MSVSVGNHIREQGNLPSNPGGGRSGPPLPFTEKIAVSHWPVGHLQLGGDAKSLQGVGGKEDTHHLLEPRWSARPSLPQKALMCPQSWRGSPASLQLSQSPYSCPFFTLPSRCSPLKFFVPGASLLSLELPRLPRSFAVFPGVPQCPPELSSLCQSSSLSAGAPPCLPELLLVRRSSSLSAGVPATSLEPLSLGVLRRFFAKLPLSSESFPVVSYDAAIAS